MNRSRYRTAIVPAVAFGLSALALRVLPASAAEGVDLALRAGVTNTDNVNRTSENQQSDTSINAGVRVSVARDTGRLDTDIAGNVEYQKYLQESSNNQFAGALSGNAQLWFVPERFSWAVQENFGQTLVDQRALDTPSNRQNLNYFSTGPNIVQRFGERTTLGLQGRWSRSTYQVTDTDDRRRQGTLTLAHQLSPHTALSLNATAEHVDSNDTQFGDGTYDRQSGYLGYDATGAKTTLSLQGGYTRLKQQDDTSGGGLFNLGISRKLTDRQQLKLTVGSAMTDSADAFRREQRITGVDGFDERNTTAAPDQYRSDFASLAWALTRPRSGLTLTTNWRREVHREDFSLDRDIYSAGLDVNRQLTPTLGVSLRGSWSRQQFDNPRVDSDEWSAGLSGSWQFARRYSLALNGDHFSGAGSGNTSLTGIHGYTENRVTLWVTFSATP